MNITIVIRQGCNGSRSLFLLVAYLIIEKMYTCLNGINTHICKIVALFFADDGMLLMQTLQGVKESIQILSNTEKDCGLGINKNKNNIMIFIIDFIANIYSGDKTTLFLNNIHQQDINITIVIRQGCNGSRSLFLLVTYLTIEKMYTCLNGINTHICKIVALFFADDGMLLMQTLQGDKESIQILSNIEKDCGLGINKNKNNIMIFNTNLSRTILIILQIKHNFIKL